MTPAPFRPRLLAGLSLGRASSRQEHLAVHGDLGRRGAAALLDEVARSGLRGRGGAGFPTAVKLQAVAARRGPRAVVVNAAEGEPLSGKDHRLLEHAPHLVLDGALAAAAAVGAGEVVVALPDGAPSARAALRAALDERSDADAVRLATVPETFLTGEESALIRALDGGPALPTLSPPRPDQRGLGRRPTLVQNAETMAHLALIARHGAAWFRETGTDTHPGSTLVTVVGCVRAPGVREIALGARLDEVLTAAGGTTEPVQAVLVGGFHGSWVRGDELGVRLDRDGLARVSATLGAGVLVALPRSACPVAEVSAVVSWLAEQGAGQCGPCVHGLAAMDSEVRALADGRATADALGRLSRWGGQLAGRGACHHPDGTVRFLRSATTVFADQFELHRRFGRCEACNAPSVLFPLRARKWAA
jgi:NADH:ubiquinone oxidoreductase subunit F (NADH-binding)